jgi:hypothetical protein
MYARVCLCGASSCLRVRISSFQGDLSILSQATALYYTFLSCWCHCFATFPLLVYGNSRVMLTFLCWHTHCICVRVCNISRLSFLKPLPFNMTKLAIKVSRICHWWDERTTLIASLPKHIHCRIVKVWCGHIGLLCCRILIIISWHGNLFCWDCTLVMHN